MAAANASIRKTKHADPRPYRATRSSPTAQRQTNDDVQNTANPADIRLHGVFLDRSWEGKT